MELVFRKNRNSKLICNKFYNAFDRIWIIASTDHDTVALIPSPVFEFTSFSYSAPAAIRSKQSYQRWQKYIEKSHDNDVFKILTQEIKLVSLKVFTIPLLDNRHFRLIW